jgi:hypothetical protein
MTSGRQTPPDVEAKIVARWVECANASQVSRELGVDLGVVTRVVKRYRSRTKAEVYEEATARAVRESQRALAKKTAMIEAYIEKHSGEDGIPNVDPKDLAALINTNSAVLQRLLDAQRNIDARKLGRLTRDLRRKEIELAKLRIAAGGIEKHEHVVTANDARSALAAILASETEEDDEDVEG